MLNKVIFITGGSASGKTTLSELIAHHFKDEAVLISQDAFYKKTTGQNFNYDIPESMDFTMMKTVIVKLKNNQATQIPVYDFVKNQTIGLKQITPKPIIIFEGLFTLYDEELLKLSDFKIFVDTPTPTRLERRIKRDVNQRGRTIESVLARWNHDVEPAYKKHIEIMMNFVDIVIPWNNINSERLNAQVINSATIKKLLMTITNIGKNH